jgi:hypothetical protein
MVLTQYLLASSERHHYVSLGCDLLRGSYILLNTRLQSTTPLSVVRCIFNPNFLQLTLFSVPIYF